MIKVKFTQCLFKYYTMKIYRTLN